ncbi:hypothetical protein KEM48_011415 [Puccinia striiformis f. sp. tritici PST-130]|nr:hypothetical protein KEM48_011415 [Puccinia striiformis f. sp. tritici PST-130]
MLGRGCASRGIPSTLKSPAFTIFLTFSPLKKSLKSLTPGAAQLVISPPTCKNPFNITTTSPLAIPQLPTRDRVIQNPPPDPAAKQPFRPVKHHQVGSISPHNPSRAQKFDIPDQHIKRRYQVFVDQTGI